ncbi:MAG: zinc dependent phospholipase C family protein [Dehalococcoidia bacterium]|nr:zinc dependent phospholipase C family protein [Dehalococcoidia bacterium]
MPHLVFHMSVARELADTLSHPTLDAYRGAYYMGSTGPDMHILDGRKRSLSHYFELDELHEQNSVATFFEAHPELRCPDELRGGAPAFVAGYISHLVIDELWITEIYRPVFGPDSPLGGDARANIMDRVLQYDMDLERRRRAEITREIRAVLLGSDLDLDIAFVDSASLRRWRDVAVEMLERPPSWDRFRYLAGRFLLNAGIDTEEKLDEFLSTVPDLLREAKEHVTEHRMTEFLHAVTTGSLAALRRYLK